MAIKAAGNIDFSVRLNEVALSEWRTLLFKLVFFFGLCWLAVRSVPDPASSKSGSQAI